MKTHAASLSANRSNLCLPSATSLARSISSLFPISILDHKHGLFTTMDGKLAIGCHTYDFDTWLRHADAVGEKEGYSPLDVEIYKLHIAHLQKVSQLLWNAKKEEGTR